MKVKLTVVQGKPEGKEFVLPVNPFVIGRGKKCHLRPNNEAIGEKHCAIIANAQKVVVRDLGSATGTQINGEKVEGDVAVKTGDLLQVGPLVFAMTLVGEKKQAAPAKAAAPAKKAPTSASSTSSPAADADEDIDVDDWLGGGGDGDDDMVDLDEESEGGLGAPAFDDLDMPADPMSADAMAVDPLATPPAAPEEQEQSETEEKKSAPSEEAATSRAASDLLRKYFTRPRE